MILKKVLFVATVVREHINVFHVPFLKMFKELGWETSVAARNDYFTNHNDCIIPFCDNYYDYLLLLIVSVSVIITVFFKEHFYTIFYDFILKNSANSNNFDISLQNITLSRAEQFQIFTKKFQNNPFLGSGFMVPFVQDYCSWSFSFGLIVESGNLFYAVLGDLGLLGIGLFFMCYGYIFISGDKTNGKVLLFITPFLICMGEMVFFSTNNNAIFLYVMLSSYLVYEGNDTGEGAISNKHSVTL